MLESTCDPSSAMLERFIYDYISGWRAECGHRRHRSPDLFYLVPIHPLTVLIIFACIVHAMCHPQMAHTCSDTFSRL